METRTKCKFVSLDKVTVETSQGDRFTLGLSGVIPFEMQEQHCQIIAALLQILPGRPFCYNGTDSSWYVSMSLLG